MSRLHALRKGLAGAGALGVAAAALSIAPAHAATSDTTALNISGGSTIANAPVEVSIVNLSDVLGSPQDSKVISDTTASPTGTFKVAVSEAVTLPYTQTGGWVDFDEGDGQRRGALYHHLASLGRQFLAGHGG